MQENVNVAVTAVVSLTPGKHYCYVSYGPSSEGEERVTRYITVDTPDATEDYAEFARELLAAVIEAL